MTEPQRNICSIAGFQPDARWESGNRDCELVFIGETNTAVHTCTVVEGRFTNE